MKLEDLAGKDFNYEPVGATLEHWTPLGFHRMYHQDRLGDEEAFAAAGEALMSWRMHAGAGLRIQTSTPHAEPGTDSLGRLGPFAVPCRVVWTVEEPDRIGFGYGTLAGHPEAGEEAFLITREGGTSLFTLTAYSKPAVWFTRLGGPLTRVAQHAFARRYVRALLRLVEATRR